MNHAKPDGVSPDGKPGDVWKPPADADVAALLRTTGTIAVVGASANPARPSHGVLAYLASSACDYEVFPVNPTATEILGLRCFPSLEALPQPPDMVNVFRRPEHCETVARNAADIGAKSLWLQLGLAVPEAIDVAVASGLAVVADRCIKVEHARLHI